MRCIDALRLTAVLLFVILLLSGCGVHVKDKHDQRNATAADQIIVVSGDPDIIIPCPAGFKLATGEVIDDPPPSAARAIATCGVICENNLTCPGFIFNASIMKCSDVAAAMHGQRCNKRSVKLTDMGNSTDMGKAAIVDSSEIVEQVDAHLGVGAEIRLYGIGASSLSSMPWLDQLHFNLQRLGYSLPVVSAKRTPEFHPRTNLVCDDSKYYHRLPTARFARAGWSSWEFALEGWQGCGKDGFHDVDGVRVRCQHGPGCAFSKQPLLVSDLARDAALSNITIIATWQSDDLHWMTHYACFDGVKKNWEDMVPISTSMILKTIRAIHNQNPNVWIVVLGKYPETFKHRTFEFIASYNHQVREVIEKEPRTLFVDFYMPSDDEGKFFQHTMHGGQLNCRGSMILVQATLARLYRARVLQRTFRLAPPSKGALLNSQCSKLSIAECHSSGLCWLNPATRKCSSYGPGIMEQNEDKH
mmetsp:Transcript_127813/g.255264  ORF Transcript_127813/g.255264 Transcript_127813/m.255264 type:complete len:473 (+) Transcript_127813:75-1493(+)